MDNNWPLSDIPTKNFSLGSQEAMCVNLGGKKMQATILVPHVACHRCSMGCSRWVRVPEGPYTMDAPGPEFETLGALGTNCMIDDLEFVSYAAHLCNIYGMDTLSCGGTIAFAMECFEKGLLTLRRHRRHRADIRQQGCHAGGDPADRVRRGDRSAVGAGVAETCRAHRP